MGVNKYFKRMLTFIIKGKNQPIIYANICEKDINNIHDEKIYLITGGGSGIGYYIAKSLIKSGASVVITGRNKQKLVDATINLGKKCEYKTMNVNNLKECESVITEVYRKYGKLDGIINNAGISLHEKNILDVTETSFDDQLNTNLKGAYFISKYYIKLYKEHKQKNGNIVFISSERGSMCDDLPYGLTKIAINSLTQGLSRRFYQDGIRVNAVAPGVTCSNLNNINKNGDLYANKSSGRVFVPEEIAEVVNYILSDFSKCISGEIINCDAANHVNSYFE